MTSPLGGHFLSHKDKSVQLEFLWPDLYRLEELWGEDMLSRAEEAFNKNKLDEIAVLIAIGAKPAMSKADVMNWSPPIFPAVAVVKAAWAETWLGTERLSQVLNMVDGKKENPLTAKMWGKSPLSGILASLGKLSRPRSSAASNGKSSGSNPHTSH